MTRTSAGAARRLITRATVILVAATGLVAIPSSAQATARSAGRASTVVTPARATTPATVIHGRNCQMDALD
jgi:hypothetical protein